jgi:hypothetical protein
MIEAGQPEGLPGSQVEQPSIENINLPEEKRKSTAELVVIPHSPDLRTVGLCVLVPPWKQGQEAALEAERTHSGRHRLTAALRWCA